MTAVYSLIEFSVRNASEHSYQSFCVLGACTASSRCASPRTGHRGPWTLTQPTAHHVTQQQKARNPARTWNELDGIYNETAAGTYLLTVWPKKFMVHWLPLSSFFPLAAASLRFARRPLTSQYLRVLSKLPLTNPFPSGVNATL